MASTHPQDSKSQRFIRGAGTVRDDDQRLWGPAKWVVQLVQYMVALILLTIGEGFKAIFTGKSSSSSSSSSSTSSSSTTAGGSSAKQRRSPRQQ